MFVFIMQSNLPIILFENCLKQQLRNSFSVYRSFLAQQFRLGDSYLKSSKDFIK